MSRSRAVIKNTIWELGYYFLVLALGFLAPRFIIITYGSEVNGLSSTITQILNIILLLQSGATTAAVFTLYTPICNNDISLVSEKVSTASAYFRKLSYIFLCIMMVVAGVTALVIDSKIERGFVFVAFIATGLKSFFDLLFTSKYRLVFTAYQERFIVSIATLLEQIVYYLLVFGSIFLKVHFIFLFFWLFAGCIVKIVFLFVAYKKLHSDIVNKKESTLKSKIPNRNYSLINEVSHSVVTSSITIMISFIYGLEQASIYSIYALVIQAIGLISNALYASFGPSFANLYAHGDKNASKRVFSIFQFGFIMIKTVIIMSTLYLIIPFVRIYMHNASDANYINVTLAILISINDLVSSYRIPFNVLVSSCGFFKETWAQPAVSAIASIIISYTFGKIDYSFILLGPIVFYLSNFIYQYIVLKKKVSFLISSKIFSMFAISIGGLILVYGAYMIYEIPDSILLWIGGSICAVIGSALYVLLMTYCFVKKEFIDIYDYLKQMVNKFGRHNCE